MDPWRPCKSQQGCKASIECIVTVLYKYEPFDIVYVGLQLLWFLKETWPFREAWPFHMGHRGWLQAELLFIIMIRLIALAGAAGGFPDRPCFRAECELPQSRFVEQRWLASAPRFLQFD